MLLKCGIQPDFLLKLNPAEKRCLFKEGDIGLKSSCINETRGLTFFERQRPTSSAQDALAGDATLASEHGVASLQPSSLL